MIGAFVHKTHSCMSCFPAKEAPVLRSLNLNRMVVITKVLICQKPVLQHPTLTHCGMPNWDILHEQGSQLENLLTLTISSPSLPLREESLFKILSSTPDESISRYDRAR